MDDENANNFAYYGCEFVNRLHLNFSGRFDSGKKMVALCCENIDNVPANILGKTGEETIDDFIALRNDVISESRNPYSERFFTKGCEMCAHYKLQEWDNDGLIHWVNLSMYPSPCQCKCIYCNIHDYDQNRFTDELVIRNYDIVFDAIDYAKY